MFERFTQEARQVVVLAQEEARSLGHNYIGTEHILLGLIRVEEMRPDAPRALQSLGVTLADARARVVRIVRPSDEVTTGQIPFTPRAKKVLELALREALSHGNNWIGPEHILLGLAREGEGVAMRVLVELDVDMKTLPATVIRMLGTMPSGDPMVEIGGSRTVRLPVDAAWLDGLGGVLMRLSGEIRRQLGREPDVGDLLVVIACAHETLGGEALRELGIDLDALWGVLERIRQRRAEGLEARRRKLEEVRKEKREALERDQFPEAERLRDEERELSAQLRSDDDLEQEVLREARRRLGLS